MADGGGGVEVAAEVAVLEGEVSRDEDIVTAWRAKDGTVVADAEGEEFVAIGKGAPNLLDEAQLSHRLGVLTHVG